MRARWDEVSKTWWTDGEDIPGLCCQTDSFEELIEAVVALAPECYAIMGSSRGARR